MNRTHRAQRNHPAVQAARAGLVTVLLAVSAGCGETPDMHADAGIAMPMDAQVDAAACESRCVVDLCEAGQLRACVAGATGCRVLAAATSCATGACADDSRCEGPCVPACASAETQCVDGAIADCDVSRDCPAWGALTACPSGECADSRECAAACEDTCVVDAVRCEDGAIERCAVSAAGCLAWGDGEACASGACAADDCAPEVMITDFTLGDDAYHSVGEQPTWVGVADFDGDGHLDVLTVNTDEVSSVSLLRGLGDGDFAASHTLATGFTERNGNLIRPVLGDIDDDGKADLLVPWRHEDQIAVYRGGERLSAPELVPAFSPESIALADFDEDGRVDFAFASDGFEDRVGVALQGLTAFAAPTYFSLGFHVEYVRTGNFDADTHADLMVLGTQIVRMSGDGTGALSEAARDTAHSLSSDSTLVADFREDGRDDYLRGYSGTNVKGMLWTTGRDTYEDSPSLYFGSGYAMASGDLNRDGHIDVVHHTCCNSFGVSLGIGDGTFESTRSFSGLGCGAEQYAVGDFNEDGLPDVAIAFSCDAVGVILNTST